MVKFEDLEIWDHIPGYEGHYKVSSKGRVWSIKNKKPLKISKHNQGYLKTKLCKDGKVKCHKIHRLVALTFYFIDGDSEGKIIDHIDHDKTNNNLLNLRFCTRAQNQHNKGLTAQNTSGYKGVCWRKDMNKWVSRIHVNGECKSLGFFNTKEEAYEAYKKASQEYHGEFGYTP